MRLLDLFCGAGGAAMGYARAGFDVVGVDIEPHPDYPFEMVVADAMELIYNTKFLSEFDTIHASPPCPRYSIATHAVRGQANHPDYLPEVRDALQSHGAPWVIENVPGAPMPQAVMLCGWAMGLRHIRRHRLFESNLLIMSPGCACPHGDTVSIFGQSGEDRRKTTIAAKGRIWHRVSNAEAKQLMDVPWMSRRLDISDAIPPAYTEFIGAQLIDQLAKEPA